MPALLGALGSSGDGTGFARIALGVSTPSRLPRRHWLRHGRVRRAPEYVSTRPGLRSARYFHREAMVIAELEGAPERCPECGGLEGPRGSEKRDVRRKPGILDSE